MKMILIQIVTLVTSYFMFRRIFSEEEKQTIWFGVLLYMTCPYRMYCCYDRVDFSQAAAWMVIPVYIWAVTGITKEKKWTDIIFGALALAGIGYANTIYFLIAFGLSILVIIALKKWNMVLALIGGAMCFFPGLLRLMEFLFTDKYDELDLSLQSIMPNGYTIGEYFAFYVYKEGRPGLGFGLFFALLSGLWLMFVAGKWEKSKSSKIFFLLAVCMLLLSMKFFPWDYVQRVGNFGLKLVALIGTPAVFGGVAELLLCVPAAWSTRLISRFENCYIAKGVTLLIVMSCLVWCVYFCSILIYQRIPY